jgi:hypothetical protein
VRSVTAGLRQSCQIPVLTDGRRSATRVLSHARRANVLDAQDAATWSPDVASARDAVSPAGTSRSAGGGTTGMSSGKLRWSNSG